MDTKKMRLDGMDKQRWMDKRAPGEYTARKRTDKVGDIGGYAYERDMNVEAKTIVGWHSILFSQYVYGQ